MPATTHASRAAAERALRMTAVTGCGIWLVGILAAVLGTTAADHAAVAWLAVIATTASWAVLALAPRTHPGQFVVTLAATSIVVLVALQQPGSANPGSGVPALWALITSVCAALLLPPAGARYIIPAYTLLIFTVTIVRSLDPTLPAIVDAVVLAAGILCAGMAVWVGSRALRLAGDSADDEARRVSEQTRAKLAAEAHRREVERLSRLLHDTCINTLGAIRDGAGLRSPDAVRLRCAHDLAQMDPLARDMGAGTLPRLTDLATAVVRDARVLEVAAQVEVRGQDSFPITPSVWQAASGALREALVNVAKHAPEARVRVEIAVTSTSVSVTVSDDGPGTLESIPPGGGIDRSILERVRTSGGIARVVPSDPHGVTVTMTWPKTLALAPSPDIPAPVGPPGGFTLDGQSDGLPVAMRGIALGSGGWMLLYCGLAAIVAVTRGAQAVPSLITLVLLALCVAFLALVAAAPLGLPVTLLLSAGIALVVVLPIMTDANACVSALPGAWSIQGATLILVLVVLFGAAWWHSGLALAGVALGLALSVLTYASDTFACGLEATAVLALEVGILIVGVGFRRMLTRQWRQAESLHLSALHDASARSEAEARDRAFEARIRAMVAGAGPLLLRVADGVLDPGDPEVRAQAGEYETALRSLLVLNSDLGPLGDALARLLLDSLESGKRLDIRCSESVPLPSTRQVELMTGIVDSAIQSSSPGDATVIALFTRPDGGALNVVAPCSDAILDLDVLARAASEGLGVRQLVLDDEVLLEVEWNTV